MNPPQKILEVFNRAVEVMGSEKNAHKWLSSPQYGLGNKIPIEYMSTEKGTQEVLDLLGRIEHGVYS